MKFISKLLLLIIATYALQAKAPAFKPASILATIQEKAINEASGLAFSRKNDGILYTHNDGNEGKIYAINLKGELIATISLPTGIINGDSDFEDIAIGAGPESNETYIYFADAGDNGATRTDKSVIRFPEPVINTALKNQLITLDKADEIKFNYDDGLRDSETLMLDPWTKEIILVSKRETFVSAYTLANPITPNKTEYTANKISTLKFGKGSFDGSGVTAGDISSDGTEILIRDYGSVYYFKREQGQTLGEVLAKDPDVISVYNLFPQTEPQGEAIAWDALGHSFFTTSEIIFSIPAKITQFKKETTEILKQKKSTNPIEIVGNKLFVNKLENDNFGKLEIFNALSQLVSNYSISEQKVIISLENLETGTYFVRYICGETPFFEKINLLK